MEFHVEGYACGTLHVLPYLFSIEVLALFVPEAEVGVVAGIRVVVLTAPVWCLLRCGLSAF